MLIGAADVYGFGTSESILGRALSGSRANVVIANKFGVRNENRKTYRDNSLEAMGYSLDESLV
jgi:myo-inositol catabolism protein IolS